MLALLLALAVLYVLFQRLQDLIRARRDLAAVGKFAKPSPREKLVTEAFEYAQAPPVNPCNVLLLYATEYGFAREVARKAAEQLSTISITTSPGQHVTVLPRIVNILHYPMIDFTRENFVAFICSTTGDGVPPNEASAFRDALVSKDLVIPPTCRISVLALGDKSYPHFCRAGRTFDGLFEPSRLLDRVDIDQEDWPDINHWTDALSTALKSQISKGNFTYEDDYLSAAIDKYVASVGNIGAQYTLNNPLKAIVCTSRLLTAPRTSSADEKEVIRVEFDIAGSDMRYDVGDALAVVPKNNSNHVTRLLLAMASNGDEMIRVGERGEPVMFETALTESLDIKTVRPELIARLRDRADQAQERAMGDRLLDGEHLTALGKEYVAEREVFDVLSDFVSARISAQELTDLLRPLHARYYSISSTPVTYPDRIAATVDVLRYNSLNIDREGVASTFLQDRCRVGESEVSIFIMRNPSFRLPKDGSKPVVMIGPGTGIAPFVGFLEERMATGASGENWLFFGCRHEKQDFLYREQLLQWSEEGKITLKTAFSRDGPTKVYVQHRMKETAEDLWRLMDSDGAHLYVCGDGAHMAGDVDDALREIIKQFGGKSEEEAKNYLDGLSDVKRYQRDVWVS